MPTILVTGGLGFIGSNTVVELQQAGYEVIIIDNLSNSSIEVLDRISKITGKKPIFEQIDLREKGKVQDFFQRYTSIEGVIHFAASKAVGESVEKPLLYYENNIASLIYILQELQKKEKVYLVLLVQYMGKLMNYLFLRMLLLSKPNLPMVILSK